MFWKLFWKNLNHMYPKKDCWARLLWWAGIPLTPDGSLVIEWFLIIILSLQRYVVFVQASNGISNATSNKVLVDVMEPISSVRTYCWPFHVCFYKTLLSYYAVILIGRKHWVYFFPENWVILVSFAISHCIMAVKRRQTLSTAFKTIFFHETPCYYYCFVKTIDCIFYRLTCTINWEKAPLF